MQTEVYYSFLDWNFRNLWYNGKHAGLASPTQTQGVSAVQTQTVIILPLQLTVTAIGLVPCGTDKSFGVRWIQSGILLAADDFTSYKEKQNWSPETITSKENHHQHLFCIRSFQIINRFYMWPVVYPTKETDLQFILSQKAYILQKRCGLFIAHSFFGVNCSLETAIFGWKFHSSIRSIHLEIQRKSAYCMNICQEEAKIMRHFYYLKPSLQYSYSVGILSLKINLC